MSLTFSKDTCSRTAYSKAFLRLKDVSLIFFNKGTFARMQDPRRNQSFLRMRVQKSAGLQPSPFKTYVSLLEIDPQKKLTKVEQVKRHFERRVARRGSFAPLDEQNEGTSENTITMGASEQLEQLESCFSPSPATVMCRKTPDDFFTRGLPEPSCMQLALSNDNSISTISAQQVSIASLEAEVVTPSDLSRNTIVSMDKVLEDLKQDEDAGSKTKDSGSETKKLKKKQKKKNKKSPKKNDTSTTPCEASTGHHQGQDQDRARPRDDSTTTDLLALETSQHVPLSTQQSCILAV